MANRLLVDGPYGLVMRPPNVDWKDWLAKYGFGLRGNMLAHRDGAKIVSGAQLTSPEYLTRLEQIAARLAGSGFNLRRVVLLLSTVFNFTLSFVLEEQRVFPRPKERSPLYNISKRNKKLAKFPTLRKMTRISLEHFPLRYREGIKLILIGAIRLPRTLPAVPVEIAGDLPVPLKPRGKNRRRKKRKR
jgi:hypothetical protein